MPSIASNILQRQHKESICGRQHDHFRETQSIVGGDTIPRGAWPWLVAIYVKKLIGDVFFQCSGALVANNLILTAAHCFRMNSAAIERKASDILLVLGRYDLCNWTEDGTMLTDASFIHVHPDYLRNGRRFDSDIAIVRTKESFEQVDSTDMPLDTIEPAETNVNRCGHFFLWGQSVEEINNVPRKLSLPIVSNEDCLRSKDSFR